ncbi:MAG: prephenate dehydrogenase/arogenate dehydrogenase family protein [Rhodanobacter sp.]|nr:MAG: prephenate dehydrogenase/arogenate dehydrogenase family protein [Rhodanobacter sp.]TAM03146.1 MAG: prephenate dehydrogenase/arogenate dehydrogenase family protein [Rhodanobacter sp.]TAM39992.1 MAG: prephenate dehydrogenase/arogenate dehydrogenase family protein [Rhodanobacter sp.]TAN23741.1 MAG: prephenate dehydrogenase/arogenate dehydrogenase family protein [Rhodanobacter sp.]
MHDAATPPAPQHAPAMRFAVLGYGRFGEAFAALLVQAGHNVRVYDPHVRVPPALAAPSLRAALDGASWVVLAMPVPHMREALHAARPLLHAGQIVFDVGSVKLHPCSTMAELLGNAIPHVGTHPLFGPLSLARGELRRTVICAAAEHPQAAERTRELFVELGCEVIDQDPESHDRAMARTHVLAFFIAKGLIDIGVDDGMPMAPPSFQGMKHMLAAVRGDAGHLFGAIQRENPFAAEARGELLAELNRIHRQLLADAADPMTIAMRPGPG